MGVSGPVLLQKYFQLFFLASFITHLALALTFLYSTAYFSSGCLFNFLYTLFLARTTRLHGPSCLFGGFFFLGMVLDAAAHIALVREL